MVQVKIRQLEELKVFNALKLSMEVLIKILVDVINRTELVRTELM